MATLLQKLFGDPNTRVVERLRAQAAHVANFEEKMKVLTLDELRIKTDDFKTRLRSRESLEDVLPEAYALVRETASRVLGQRHFDVQIMGGIALHQGTIAEMRTGEGKTLVATLPAYLNALTGEGVHVVTVNDYLARRDAAWMGRVYHALGLTVGCINHETAYVFDPAYHTTQTTQAGAGSEESSTLSFAVGYDYLRPVHRKEAYQADILYGTNNEYGFDYLRDNMVARVEQRVQRPLNVAIIDEIDSILIDEARTPLIISAPAEEATDQYYTYAEVVKQLYAGTDFNIDEKQRTAVLTEAGIEKVERILNMANIYAEGGFSTVHHLEQALKAYALFHKDKDYIVKDGEVIIVDEFTGRLMNGRRYSEGLHQAIEAKEGVRIQKESQTLATITFQNYFRLYKKLAGMTGTAATEAEEFHKIYKLEVVQIPPHRVNKRTDHQDKIYVSESAKFNALVEDIKERNAKGQPILVGTISIEKNEIISQLLVRAGVTHEVLNAKNHEREAEIIAQAGKLGRVTIATNMAGRGVDIILGGNPVDVDEAARVRELGGLCVIGTERHESRRIDNQLRGRAGRQGDPGESRFYVSLDDDLMRIFAGERVKSMMARLGLPEDTPIENGFVSRSLESAQTKIEQHNFDIRKHLLEYDDVLNKQREVMYRRRNEILTLVQSDREMFNDRILESVHKEVEALVQVHTASEDRGAWDTEELYEAMSAMMPVVPTARVAIEELRVASMNKLDNIELRQKIVDYIMVSAREQYSGYIARVVEATGSADGWYEGVKALALRSIDVLWIEHLEQLDSLRRGIGLRAYGQRDPLVEYKREAFRLFQELLVLVDKEVAYSLFKTGIAMSEAVSIYERKGVTLSAPAKEGDAGSVAQSADTAPEDNQYKDVGRNDVCPCGSGKKFKKCHGL